MKNMSIDCRENLKRVLHGMKELSIKSEELWKEYLTLSSTYSDIQLALEKMITVVSSCIKYCKMCTGDIRSASRFTYILKRINELSNESDKIKHLIEKLQDYIDEIRDRILNIEESIILMVADEVYGE